MASRLARKRAALRCTFWSNVAQKDRPCHEKRKVRGGHILVIISVSSLSRCLKMCPVIVKIGLHAGSCFWRPCGYAAEIHPLQENFWKDKMHLCSAVLARFVERRPGSRTHASIKKHTPKAWKASLLGTQASGIIFSPLHQDPPT